MPSAVLLTGVGKRYDIVSAFSAHAFTIAVDPSLHPREGELLRITPRAEQMHLFDAETGQRRI